MPSITSKSEPAPLQVAYSLWPGYFPMVIAQEKGFFTQQGVKVELVYLKNYLEPLSEFSTGKYDGVVLAMSSVVNTSDGQIVLVTDRSAGADTFLANTSITTLADVLGEFGELFVLNLLEQNRLTTDDVTLVNVEGEAVPQSLQKGDIQAGHTWSPYSSQAIKAGAKVLFTSKQTPGLIPSVVLFRNNPIRDRPKQIAAFIRA
ncbi:MAG: ABC transporter substrate-binding protein [Microcoleus vaginatus WJT46-NPBG5]|nr:ABC transporter substrate-binding protein [Microcoleus vaginatus WJT46-NPBG5]